MTVTFYTPGAELGKYRLTENTDGSITIHLNDGQGTAAGWCTITSRLDAAHLRQLADDADALFIRRNDVSRPGPGEDAGVDAGPGHPDDLEPLPPSPQRTPAGPYEPHPGASGQDFGADDLEPRPGGTIYPELTEEALAGQVPLGTLAPEPEENEVKR